MTFSERGYRTTTFGFGMTPTPVVKKLLIANVVVFVLTLLAGWSFAEFFAFYPDARFLTHPWGVFTYMFVHAGLGHLFGNMLGLFFFGPALEAKWGGREFFRFYVVTGLGGAALYMAAFMWTGGPIMVGASAAIYGILLAFAMNWPNAPIYVMGIYPIRAKWLVLGYGVLTVLGVFGGAGSGVAHHAHLGGFLAAYLYLKLDWRIASKLAALRRPARAPRRMAIVPKEDWGGELRRKSKAGSGGGGEEERELLDAVDRVLDKISQEGIASLTPKERKVLDRAARRHKTN